MASTINVLQNNYCIVTCNLPQRIKKKENENLVGYTT